MAILPTLMACWQCCSSSERNHINKKNELQWFVCVTRKAHHRNRLILWVWLVISWTDVGANKITQSANGVLSYAVIKILVPDTVEELTMSVLEDIVLQWISFPAFHSFESYFIACKSYEEMYMRLCWMPMYCYLYGVTSPCHTPQLCSCKQQCLRSSTVQGIRALGGRTVLRFHTLTTAPCMAMHNRQMRVNYIGVRSENPPWVHWTPEDPGRLSQTLGRLTSCSIARKTSSPVEIPLGA